MLVALSMGLAHAGLPETPRFRQLGTEQGLPSDTVTGLVQDLQGYIWVGTIEGLARFDGLEFRVWQKEQGLPGNAVLDLALDGNDRLWLAIHDNLVVLDREREIGSVFNAENTPGMADTAILTVHVDAHDNVWFGTDGAGLFRLAPDGQLSRFQHDPVDTGSLPSSTVNRLGSAANGDLLIGTRGGVARWSEEKFERIPELAYEDAVLHFTFDDQGALWVGSPSGAGYSADGGVFSRELWPALESANPVYGLLAQDRKGLYWWDTRHGLVFGNRDQVVGAVLYSKQRQGEVRPDWRGGLEDRSGGLWLYSAGIGVWYLPPDWRQFSSIMHRYGDLSTIGNEFVTAIAPASDGTMWLAGSNGVLERIDPDTGEFPYRYGDNEDYVPSALVEDRDGNVWVGFDDGIAKVDVLSRKVRIWDIRDPDQPAMEGRHRGLVLDHDGNVWSAAMQSGVQLRDLDGRVLRDVLAGTDELPFDAPIMAIDRGPDGSVWAATATGLAMWNDGIQGFEAVPGSPDSSVNDFALGGSDRIWLLEPAALVAYSWNGASMREIDRLTTAEGLPESNVYGLTVDADGIVWMTSSRGLIRADPHARDLHVYGIDDGLPSQEISVAPVPRPYDGRILLAPAVGLVMFDPRTVRPLTEVADPVIETIDVLRANAQSRQSLLAPYRLRHDDREVTVTARLLDYQGARNNRYRFRLEGYDADWVEVGASGDRVFPALRPGRHRLDVMARTSRSPWSAPVSVEFDVAAPWWMTWWGMALLVLAMLAILAWAGVLYRRRLLQQLRLRRIEHENEVAVQASLAKSRFLATLGHEVRTPMTGVLGMSELLLDTSLDDRQAHYAGAIRRAGQHLMRLLDDALDLARIEAGKLELDPQPFRLAALLEDVTSLMQPIASQRGLAFALHMDERLPDWLSGDAVRIRQILLNLLGNAVKFTEAGSVTLDVCVGEDAGKIRFEVSDTGPGLSADQLQRLFRRFEQAEGARTTARYGGSGLGLAISRELALQMQGDIEVDSEPGKGTRFIVELPLPVVERMQKAATDERIPTAARACHAILLVEDDPVVAEVIVGLLQGRGHSVTHVPHGLAALTAVAMDDFDLWLLDLDLPGIDGLQLMRQLRVQDRQVPAIAVTARADEDAERLAREAGFDDFLRKPLTGQMLDEAIETVLKSSTP